MAAFCVCMRFYTQSAPYRLFVDLEQCRRTGYSHIRIENGLALVEMGACKTELCYRRRADNRAAVLVPAGTWHNMINIGNTPLKLYSIYAPPQHPFGTVQQTRQDAEYET